MPDYSDSMSIRQLVDLVAYDRLRRTDSRAGMDKTET
jgi:hypothetical protein